ncbi:MAG: transposase [Proteobacteria bacterium]|nr:transposase [Pseudomonadota bacterium]
MARLPRAVLAGELHLVIHRGQSGLPVFLDDDDRRRYLDALTTAARDHDVAVHAYALRPTQVRLLLTPSTGGALAGLMQSIGRRYVRGFNQAHGRTGTPWEGRFRSTVVEAARYFVPGLRFVEEIGVGTEDAIDTTDPFASSAPHHLGLQPNPLITEHPGFWTLGNTPFEREAAYRTLHDMPLPPDERRRIADAALKGWALASDAYAAQAAEQAGRRTRPAARGRPRVHKPGDD